MDQLSYLQRKVAFFTVYWKVPWQEDIGSKTMLFVVAVLKNQIPGFYCATCSCAFHIINQLWRDIRIIILIMIACIVTHALLLWSLATNSCTVLGHLYVQNPNYNWLILFVFYTSHHTTPKWTQRKPVFKQLQFGVHAKFFAMHAKFSAVSLNIECTSTKQSPAQYEYHGCTSNWVITWPFHANAHTQNTHNKITLFSSALLWVCL